MDVDARNQDEAEFMLDVEDDEQPNGRALKINTNLRARRALSASAAPSIQDSSTTTPELLRMVEETWESLPEEIDDVLTDSWCVPPTDAAGGGVLAQRSRRRRAEPAGGALRRVHRRRQIGLSIPR